MIQSSAFQAAVAAQRFRRQVRRLVEPFVIVAGYGDAGRIVGADLDEHYRRFVVIDKREDRVESVSSGHSASTSPLSRATAPHRPCSAWPDWGTASAGVLALTNDDDANLAVVMATSLLRPDLPVLGRCAQQRTRTRMEHFAPASAINADDRFGDYQRCRSTGRSAINCCGG